MTSEILGMVSTSYGSESAGWSGDVVDPAYLAEFARAHERAGFDRVLVAHSGTGPDALAAADHVLHSTDALGVLVAQRPGFTAPTITARALATLERLNGEGRVALHNVTGGSDADQRRDGDFVDKDSRYRRTAEFMEIVRATFASPDPIDHEGEFYRVEDAHSAVRPVRPDSIRMWFGGQSDAAVAVGAEHADTYALWGEPLADTAERIGVIRDAAARLGRSVDFSLSTRPIVADTEDAAWERAAGIQHLVEEHGAQNAARLMGVGARSDSVAVGAERLKARAREKDVHDERLWFGVTKLLDGAGNSSALVGTSEQVVDALTRYREIGVTRFLIRGFDPLEDVRRWGEDLVPRLRSALETADAA